MKKLSKKQLKANWIIILKFLYPDEPISERSLRNSEIGNYHTDWDWLMPLWEAVNNKGNYSIGIYPNYCYLINEDGCQINDDYCEKSIQLSIYMACVDAIKITNLHNLKN